MEPDRYQQNQKHYIVGLASLLISMTLFGLSAYIFPRVAFGLVYRLPDFIFNWINLVHIAYNVSEKTAGWLVLCIFFLLGLLFALITYVLSNHIDNQIYAIETPSEMDETIKPINEFKETGPLVLKILLIVIFIFVIAKVLLWAISNNQ